MKFFIPAARDKAEERHVYDAIRTFLGKELGADFSERKVYKLRYSHNGKEYHAEVGNIDRLEREPVVAILYEPLRDLYHVCTTNRGVVRGISILVGGRDVISVEDFESENA